MAETEDSAGSRSAGTAASASRSLEVQSAELCMENLIHKLHLLNYRTAFYGSKFGKHRGLIHSSYFSSSAPGRSQSEQFYCFINLAAWLVTEYAGMQVKPLKEGEDATAALSQLLSALKQLKFAVPPTFTPARLQAGHGAEVCGVLDGLADLALERSGFKFVAQAQDREDDDAAMDTAPVDLTSEMMHGDIDAAPYADDDYDLEIMGLGLNAAGGRKERHDDAEEDDRKVLENTIDPAQWELEVQQVAPKLQIRLAAEARDWRMHLESASQDKAVFVSAWPESQTALTRLRQELAEHLDKVDTRERFLNNEFATWTDEYRNKKDVFAQKQAAFEKSRAENGEAAAELQKFVEQIEEMQGDLDERSSSRSDAGPTAKVGNAIDGLRREITQMDVQLGVIRQQLLLVRMKERLASAIGAGAPVHG